MNVSRRTKPGATKAAGECHIIEHTADIGLRCNAPTLARLFECAARSMFTLIASLEDVKCAQPVPISLEAPNLEELFVNWLEELLYIWESKRILLSRFTVKEIQDHCLEAEVAGETYDPGRHELHSEIKAATYHGLRIEQKQDLWEVRVIFDL